MLTVTAEREVVTLKEVAIFFKISESKVYHEWPSWRDKGVRVLLSKANDRPRFYLSDIKKMMERAK